MLALRVLLAGAAIVGSTIAYAANAPFAVRPGLWQVTLSTTMSGAPPIPASALARMTPAQKARAQAAMDAAMAAANRPKVLKQCLTAAQLEKGFDVAQEHESCARTVVSSSPMLLVIHMECTHGDSKMVAAMRFQATDDSTMSGAVDMTMAGHGHDMRMQSAMTGKWLASDCGHIKPGQPE